MDKRLIDELAAELLVPPPGPYVLQEESAEVKRARLEQLDRDLNPHRYEKPTPASDFVAGLGGRVCDLPGHCLDWLARRMPDTAELRRANRFVNRRRWSS